MACRAGVFWIAFLACVGLGSATANATSTPTWVSASGTNSGSCSLAAPCATFQYALSQTTAGGTIFVANSGSYGPINIPKAVSIIAPEGVQATVYVGQGLASDAIKVNPGSGNNVLLKGLTVILNNANAGFFAAIEVFTGRVSIENCVITTGNWGIYTDNPDFLLIRNNRIENTGRGIENHNNVSTIYLDRNSITLNGYALVGNFNSYGNNTMNGNTLCDTCAATITAASFDQ